MRKIVIVGWDGRSNPMYRFYDQIDISDHIRDRPMIHDIVSQFPNARFTTAQFKEVPLSSFLPSNNG